MAQTCGKCSRANPSDAVYCYYDGMVLGGHARNGGPVAVGAQLFAHPFVFPSGKTCRSFDELALACQDDWNGARDLLQQGYLETFLGGLGRMDLVMAAKEASKFPDHDRGLDQFLGALPSDVLDAPKLALETQEINLGILPVGASGRDFKLHLENKGMRLLYGSVTCTDALWLSLGEGPGATEKHFQFGNELVLPLRVVGDRLRAGAKPLEAHLAVETNGGSATLTVRAETPVKPFPNGVLAGAVSPRKVAEKAKASPKEAAPLFENGEVIAWYKSNGWTYPVQGPPASGLAAVQQFFEALGLTPAPKVKINVKSIPLSGSPGATLRYAIEVKTEEKKPIYAHGTSNQPWLEVGRAKINGRTVTVPLSVPSVPNQPGQSLVASITVQSNGNQRFVVPVSLQVEGGNVFNFDEPAPVLAAEPEIIEIVEAPSDRATGGNGAAARPVAAPRIQAAPAPALRPYARSRPSSKPAWVHLLPAGLLGMALLIVVIADLTGAGSNRSGADDSAPASNKLSLRFNNENHRFGLEMPGVPDPRPDFKGDDKKITYDKKGGTNNTIVNIEGSEIYFGEWNPDRKISSENLPAGRIGNRTVEDVEDKKVRVTQHVEIVAGPSGQLDTCLVWYHVENYGDAPTRVGLRFMLDTFIGANDGVPFTAPGVKDFIKDMREFKGGEIPPYLEAVENPDDPKDPGTVVRLGLTNVRLPDEAKQQGVTQWEEPDDVRITHFPPQGGRQGWNVPMASIQPIPDDDKADSCVVLYWPYEVETSGAAEMPGKSHRDMAFTYGLSQLDISTGGGDLSVGLRTPDHIVPDSDFTVTARVYKAEAGDAVELTLPAGLTLAAGETATKTVEQGGQVDKVEWKVHAGPVGAYTIQVKCRGVTSRQPVKVAEKGSSYG